MSESSRRPAFIAVARSFIDDLRFRRPANRPLTHSEAILWLLSKAAWKPSAQANRFGAIHNERGQLSTTHRTLAREWAWSKGKVGRFLAELKREGTISVEFARCGAKPGTDIGPQAGYARTLITLVNYERFNGALRTMGQRAGRKVGQNHPELPGLIYAIAPQPTGTRQAESSSKRQASRGGGYVGKPIPEHGKKTRDGKVLFLHCGTDDWREYAADFEHHRGFAPLPTRYIDGQGNWFMIAGEAGNQAMA